MTSKRSSQSDARLEAVMLLERRIKACGSRAVEVSQPLLDLLSDTLLNSRRICFTGLGQYEEQPG